MERSGERAWQKKNDGAGADVGGSLQVAVLAERERAESGLNRLIRRGALTARSNPTFHRHNIHNVYPDLDLHAIMSAIYTLQSSVLTPHLPVITSIPF